MSADPAGGGKFICDCLYFYSIYKVKGSFCWDRTEA